MAGVFTDNQPDFSFLAPYETRTFSQWWYPIRAIGPAHDGEPRCGGQPAPSRRHRARRRQRDPAAAPARGCSSRGPRARSSTAAWTSRPMRRSSSASRWPSASSRTTSGCVSRPPTASVVIDYRPARLTAAEPPPPATEPPLPGAIGGQEALFLTGRHLEQYRHATRDPGPYWREAVRPRSGRQPGAHGPRGMAPPAGRARRRRAPPPPRVGAADRAQPQPRRGRAGLPAGRHAGPRRAPGGGCRGVRQGSLDRGLAVARPDGSRGCPRSPGGLRGRRWRRPTRPSSPIRATPHARVLGARSSAGSGGPRMPWRPSRRSSRDDPHDAWARHERDLLGGNATPAGRSPAGRSCTSTSRTTTRAPGCSTTASGCWPACSIRGRPEAPAHPMVHYTIAWLADALGDTARARRHAALGRASPPDLCFPARVEEIAVLELANGWTRTIRARRTTWGCCSTTSAGTPRRSPPGPGPAASIRRSRPSIATSGSPSGTSATARATPGPRTGVRSPRRRTTRGSATSGTSSVTGWAIAGGPPPRARQRPDLVAIRDDLTVERLTLLDVLGRHDEVLDVLRTRRFHPWEGGEGLVSGLWVRANVAIARAVARHGGTRRGRSTPCTPPATTRRTSARQAPADERARAPPAPRASPTGPSATTDAARRWLERRPRRSWTRRPGRRGVVLAIPRARPSSVEADDARDLARRLLRAARRRRARGPDRLLRDVTAHVPRVRRRPRGAEPHGVPLPRGARARRARTTHRGAACVPWTPSPDSPIIQGGRTAPRGARPGKRRGGVGVTYGARTHNLWSHNPVLCPLS